MDAETYAAWGVVSHTSRVLSTRRMRAAGDLSARRYPPLIPARLSQERQLRLLRAPSTRPSASARCATRSTAPADLSSTRPSPSRCTPTRSSRSPSPTRGASAATLRRTSARSSTAPTSRTSRRRSPDPAAGTTPPTVRCAAHSLDCACTKHTTRPRYHTLGRAATAATALRPPPPPHCHHRRAGARIAGRAVDGRALDAARAQWSPCAIRLLRRSSHATRTCRPLRRWRGAARNLTVATAPAPGARVEERPRMRRPRWRRGLSSWVTRAISRRTARAASRWARTGCTLGCGRHF
eukprot:633555-Prymnesium_polylepis.1